MEASLSSSESLSDKHSKREEPPYPAAQLKLEHQRSITITFSKKRKQEDVFKKMIAVRLGVESGETHPKRRWVLQETAN